MKTLILVFAVLSALMPVITQRTGLSERYGFKMKMLCALMYLITGALSAFFAGASVYTLMILGALVSGALGDFFLSYRNEKYFFFGVVFFALGHIVYSLTFLFAGNYKALPYIGALAVSAVVITAAVIAFAGAKLVLKGRKNLLLIYVPVLVSSFVCAVAGGVIAVECGNMSYGLCVISGGTLFLVSDIMIGIGKGGIKRPAFMHNAVSYTYFTAQTLFALSIYFQ